MPLFTADVYAHYFVAGPFVAADLQLRYHHLARLHFQSWKKRLSMAMSRVEGTE